MKMAMRGVFLALAAHAVCAYTADGALQAERFVGPKKEPHKVRPEQGQTTTTTTTTIVQEEVSESGSTAQKTCGKYKRRCKAGFKCSAGRCKRKTLSAAAAVSAEPEVSESGSTAQKTCGKYNRRCQAGYKCSAGRCKRKTLSAVSAEPEVPETGCINNDRSGQGTPPSARPDMLCDTRSYDECDNQRWCKWYGPPPKQGCKVKEWNWHVGLERCSETSEGYSDTWNVWKAPYDDQWCARCKTGGQSPCTQIWNNALAAASCSGRYNPESPDLGYESCVNQAYCEWYGDKPDDCGRNNKNWRLGPGCCLSEGYDALWNMDAAARTAVNNDGVHCSGRDMTTCNAHKWCQPFLARKDISELKIISNVASWKAITSATSVSKTMTQTQSFSESSTVSTQREVSTELRAGVDVKFFEAGASVTLSKTEESSRTFTHDFSSETSLTYSYDCTATVNGYLYLWQLTTKFVGPDGKHGTVITPSPFIICGKAGHPPKCPPTGPQGCDGEADSYCQICFKE